MEFKLISIASIIAFYGCSVILAEENKPQFVEKVQKVQKVSCTRSGSGAYNKTSNRYSM